MGLQKRHMIRDEEENSVQHPQDDLSQQMKVGRNGPKESRETKRWYTFLFFGMTFFLLISQIEVGDKEKSIGSHNPERVADLKSRPRPGDGESSRLVSDERMKSIHVATTNEKVDGEELSWAGSKKNPKRVDTPVQSRPGSDADSIRSLSNAEIVSIHVATANKHRLGASYEKSVPKDCKYKEKLMKCTYTRKRNSVGTPDVLLYHMPNAPDYHLAKDFPSQLIAGFSLEPGSYYRHQMDPEYLKQFDIRSYYSRSSEVPILQSYDFMQTKNNLFKPVQVPTQEKLSKLVYINRNCGAPNGRNNIVKKIMDIGDIEVHSFGACLNNKGFENRESNWGTQKTDTMSKYKFCIAMENSNEIDYVSEKLWQAIDAGCIPVYYGAPNIADFLPVPVTKIIINYADFGSPKALSDELVRISNNDTLYDEFFAWKKLDPDGDQILPGFRFLQEHASSQHPKCQVCAYAAKLLEERKQLGNGEEWINERNETSIS